MITRKLMPERLAEMADSKSGKKNIMNKKKVEKIIKIGFAIVGVIFAGMNIIAKFN